MNGLLNISLFIAIFTIAECGVTPEQRERLLALHHQCAPQTGVTDEVAMKGLEGDFPDDPNFKEHMFCFCKITGFQNEAGELQPKVIRKTLKNEEIMSKCIVQKSTPQDTAMELTKCTWAIKHGIF